jgi:hypothetical protein
MRFDRPILEAIVKEGRISDPEAAAYLVKTLLARRNKIGATYLEALTALDDFTVDADKLCARDLGIAYGLAKQGVVHVLGDDDEVKSEHTVDRRGRVCLPVPKDDRYTVYRLRMVRKKVHKPPLQIHFKAGKRPRILGLIRAER